MRKDIYFGIGYQAISFFLLLIQAALLPRYLGLELYGVGLFLLLPVLLLGGLWEPVVQKLLIESGGFSNIKPVMFFYIFVPVYCAYVFFFFADWFSINLLIGCFFIFEYIFSILVTAWLYKNGSYNKVFYLAAVGLLLSSTAFCLSASPWLLTIFYILYFLPVSAYGIIFITKIYSSKSMAGQKRPSVMNAISTRLFYVLVNNFYIIVVGAFLGASTAAVLKISVSLSSAFRFCSPMSIGHFYSKIHHLVGVRRFIHSLVPLVSFALSICFFLLLLPFFEKQAILVFGENYYSVIGFFSKIAWGVPFYLWSPYLTTVFSKDYDWKIICSIIVLAITAALPFLFVKDEAWFFNMSCILYCAGLICWGALVKKEMVFFKKKFRRGSNERNWHI